MLPALCAVRFLRPNFGPAHMHISLRHHSMSKTRQAYFVGSARRASFRRGGIVVGRWADRLRAAFPSGQRSKLDSSYYEYKDTAALNFRVVGKPQKYKHESLPRLEVREHFPALISTMLMV